MLAPGGRRRPPRLDARVVLLACGVAYATPLAGQDDRVYVSRYTVDDGLAQNLVTALVQDSAGFMALGATPDGVRRGVLVDTGRLAVLGLVIGLPLSWMAARAIRGLLYDVGSFDAVTFGAALVALVAVAVCGGYLPARRATRVDPVFALRPR